MAVFPGGSAYAMARDVGEGYLLVTERTFTRFAPGELDQIGFELDRYLRETRAEQPPLDDLLAIKRRNRKIQRITSAQTVLANARAKMRRAVAPPTPGPKGAGPKGAGPKSSGP